MLRKLVIIPIIITCTLVTTHILAQNGQALAKIHVDENGNVEVLDIMADQGTGIPSLPDQFNQNTVYSQSAASGHAEQLSQTMNPGPDLTWDPAWTLMSYIYPYLTIQVRVVNNGTAASTICIISFYLSEDNSAYTTGDNILLEGQAVLGLAPGEASFKIMSNKDISAHVGTWFVTFWIDNTNLVHEDVELNNSYEWYPAIEVGPQLPDLSVSEIKISDWIGPNLSFLVKINNGGTATTTGSFKNSIYLTEDINVTTSDYWIYDWNCNTSVAPGETETSNNLYTTVSGVPAGVYYLGVIADRDHMINELNENNNTKINRTNLITITDPLDKLATIEVPKAGIAPVIDGVMDPVWYSVCTIPMEEWVISGGITTTNWVDAYASFKMMYDDNNYYLFIQAHDDIVNISGSEPWDKDSFEIFFDGDNSKNDVSTGFDVNDVQLRYIHGENSENTGNAPNSICQFLDTPDGYNCEIQIPAADMTFTLVPGYTFGFDIVFNDNDTGNLDTRIQWWTDNYNNFMDPSLWGTAITIAYVASNPMYILETSTAPVIDGNADDAVWSSVPWFSDNTFVTHSGGSPLIPPFDIANINGWNDCRLNYKMAWQGNMLYLYAKVFDNIISTSSSSFWDNDGFQIFLDGNNDKSALFDADDGTYDCEYSTTPVSDMVFTPTSSGYTMELQMDLSANPGVIPALSNLMGFDIQLDDNDGIHRDLLSRWWGDDLSAYTKPNLWGTIQFTNATSMPSQSSSNQMSNGDFSKGLQDWEFDQGGTSDASGLVEEGVFHAQINNGGDNLGDISLEQDNLALAQGNMYTLSFKAKAEDSRDILYYVGTIAGSQNKNISGVADSQTFYVYEDSCILTSDWKTFTRSFIMTQPTDEAAVVGFGFGTSDENVYLDDVMLIESTTTSIESDAPVRPSQYALSQNYPNPFNPTTTIRFDLPKSSFVALKIFDVLGREVTTLINEKRPAGKYAVEWNSKGLPSGIYLYQLNAGEFTETRKLVLQK